MTDAVELRNYWYTLRTPEIRLLPEGAGLRLPTYFGGTMWIIPWDQIAVTDLTRDDPVEPRDDIEFTELLSVPYLFTTGPVFEPNLLLTFKVPQRVPPLAPVAALAPNVDLPFGYFSTRSEAGDVVDGLLLRAKDPATAAASLAAAGASEVADPARWLASHRRTVQDPMTRQRLAARDRLIRNQALARTVLGYGALGLIVLAILRDPFDALSVLLITAALLAAVAAWSLTRRLKRLTQRS